MKTKTVYSVEYKVMRLRETPSDSLLLDDPNKVAAMWRSCVTDSSWYNQDVEQLVAVMLNVRRRMIGYHLVSMGIADTLLVHPREVFRTAIVASAGAIILIHNHPSGDPAPSEADIKVTRELCRAGQLIRIEVLDHVIIGNPNHVSLREMGYFYS